MRFEDDIRATLSINSDYEETVPVIRASVESLGFKFSDIKILLGSHAHPDHMTGDAMVKQLTGANVMAMEQDVPALNNIRPGGSRTRLIVFCMIGTPSVSEAPL